MERLVTNYAFNKVLRTISSNEFNGMLLEQISKITDVTNNVVIYDCEDPSRGGVLLGTVLTLDYATNSDEFNNTDKFRIEFNSVTSLPVSLPDGSIITGPLAQSAANIDLLTGVVNGWFDAASFQSGTIQLIASAGISAGAIFFEQTNDNANTVGIPLLATEVSVINTNPNNTAITIAANANRIFRFAINARYMRIRISTAFVGGTLRAIGFFSEFPFSSNVMNVQQALAANFLVNSLAQYAAGATGAASRTHIVSAAGTNATIVRNTSAKLVGWQVSNTNAAWRYVKLHNQATTPTAGAGVVQTLAVPPNSTINSNQEGGIGFATGIGLTTVTGAADNDSNGVAANDLIIDLFWS